MSQLETCELKLEPEPEPKPTLKRGRGRPRKIKPTQPEQPTDDIIYESIELKPCTGKPPPVQAPPTSRPPAKRPRRDRRPTYKNRSTPRANRPKTGARAGIERKDDGLHREIGNESSQDGQERWLKLETEMREASTGGPEAIRKKSHQQQLSEHREKVRALLKEPENHFDPDNVPGISQNELTYSSAFLAEIVHERRWNRGLKFDFKW